MSTSVPSVPPASPESSKPATAEPAQAPIAEAPSPPVDPPASVAAPAVEPAPAEPAPSVPDRPRALTTFFTFLLLGPPIGGFIFVIAIYVTDRLSRPGSFTTIDAMDVARTAAITIPFSYVFGGLQALAVAIYLARRRRRGGVITIRHAFGAALVVSALFAPLLYLIRNDPVGVGAGPAAIDTWLVISASLGALSLAASLACALILRLKWSARRR